MKIILIRHLDSANINTRVPESLIKIMGHVPPLGIAYIAAVLEKNGYEVKIIDSQASNFTKDLLKKKLLYEKPDIVGITAMTPTIRGSMEASEIAKKAGATVIIGGPHLAACPVETVSHPYIDYGIIGEGEYAMLELVKAIENNSDIKNIKGLVYKINGKVVMNEPVIIEDIDSLPFPARHLLPMDRYSSVIALHPMTTILVGRGCPFKCGFCFKQPSDKKFRVRDFKKVIDEMEFCIKEYKVREIMILDDTFTIKKEFVENFCNEIITRGIKIKWEATTRIDVIDKKLLSLMQQAGCIRLRYGIESANPEILKIMNKQIDLTKAKEVMKWTKQAGIETFAYFIIGYYSETAKMVEQTIKFAKELNPDMVMFLKAGALPNTDLFNYAVKENLAGKNYWSNYTLGITEEPIKPFLQKSDEYVRHAYRTFYLRPSYIIKQVSKLRSFDMFKKYLSAGFGLIFFRMKNEKNIIA